MDKLTFIVVNAVPTENWYTCVSQNIETALSIITIQTIDFITLDCMGSESYFEIWPMLQYLNIHFFLFH